MKKFIAYFSFVVFLVLLVLPFSVWANAGMSLDTGKIVLQEKLTAGGRYTLPTVEVKNTGDESSDFEMTVQYNDVQKENKPDAKWFNFEPAKFHLLAGESKIIKTSVSLPANISSGDYFAYIEAHSVSLDKDKSFISGAVAAKLYFTVAKFNIFKTAFYGTVSFIKNCAPWTYVILWIISVIIFSAFWKHLKLIIKHFRAKS
jgi:hypothetical protein